MITRYSYHQDPENPRRILSTARQWEPGDDKIVYSFAVCNPLDQHSKRKARLMLDGRLKSCRSVHTCTYVEGQAPLALVLEAIAEDARAPRVAQHIAQNSFYGRLEKAGA